MLNSKKNVLRTLGWIASIFIIGFSFISCDDNTTGSGDDGYNVPSAYTFDSRFQDTSSVAYPGQTVRNLLIRDLKIYTDRLGSDSYSGGALTMNDLLKFYEYEDSMDLQTLTGTGDYEPYEAHYSDITTGKDLAGKATSEYANIDLVNTDSTADEFIRHYFQQIVENSQNAENRGTPAIYTTETGVNMSQMINKLLLGAVVYSQGTSKYLNIWRDAGNSEPSSSGSPYTTMEHIWDEAFGYFGAARNFSDFSDQDLVDGNLYQDANGDGMINFHSEYNFTYAGYAAKRDVGGSGTDYSENLFNAFLEGRAAISNQASESQIQEQAEIAKENWEKVVAANVVHYMNSTLSDMDGITQDQIDNKNNWALNEHWSEMKAFVYVLQYNNDKMISDEDLSQLDQLIGEAPPYYLPDSQNADDVRSNYQDAKEILKSTYEFSDENMGNW